LASDTAAEESTRTAMIRMDQPITYGCPRSPLRHCVLHAQNCFPTCSGSLSPALCAAGCCVRLALDGNRPSPARAPAAKKKISNERIRVAPGSGTERLCCLRPQFCRADFGGAPASEVSTNTDCHHPRRRVTSIPESPVKEVSTPRVLDTRFSRYDRLMCTAQRHHFVKMKTRRPRIRRKSQALIPAHAAPSVTHGESGEHTSVSPPHGLELRAGVQPRCPAMGGTASQISRTQCPSSPH